MPRLVTLAKIVAAVHMPICVIIFAAMFFALSALSPTSPMARSMVITGGLLTVSFVFSKFVFNDDCALRIFEYCLRGLGGQEIDHNRLNSMSTPEAMSVGQDELYQRLLWQSGLFLLIAIVVMIGGAVAAAIFI